MAQVQVYHDPIISLIKDPDLNKSQDKSDQLLTIINNLTDFNQIKKKCLLGFQILRDLEKLQLRSKNWEFLSLDFSIESILNDDKISETKSKFQQDLTKKVLSNCVEMNETINEISNKIDEINRFIKLLPFFQFISDQGTILITISLRILNLKNQLINKLTIIYSKLKLINIGINLEKLLENTKFNHLNLSSYRAFINQLLKQLNDSINLNDSIEILECIEIINDLEQMFENVNLSLDHNYNDSISLQHTTLQDEMPHLLSLFDTVKTVEDEIRSVRSSNELSVSNKSNELPIDLSNSYSIYSNNYLSNSMFVKFGLRPKIVLDKSINLDRSLNHNKENLLTSDLNDEID